MKKVWISFLIFILTSFSVLAEPYLSSTSNDVVDVPTVNYGRFIKYTYDSEDTYSFLEHKESGTLLGYAEKSDVEKTKLELVEIFNICDFEAKYSFIVKHDLKNGANVDVILNKDKEKMKRLNYAHSAIVSLERVVRNTYRSKLDGEDIMNYTFEFCMNSNGMYKFEVIQ